MVICSLSFDAAALRAELERLEPLALERILRRLDDDLSPLPFDLILSEYRPATIAGSADEVLIRLRLLPEFERSATA